jgi:hypothetical protein
MQEDNRVPTANVDVTDLAVSDAHATTGMIVFGRNPVRHGIALLAIRGAVKRRPGIGCDPRDQRASSNQVQRRQTDISVSVVLTSQSRPAEAVLPALATGARVSQHICPRSSPNRTRSKERLGYMGIGLQTWSFEMPQILALSVALLLIGSGVWANFGDGSLSQNKGAWVSHAH